MKTAMQELIDKLSNSIKFEYRNELVNALEKEKEQIVKAFNDGHHADVGHVDKAWEYYNQTYNQEPKKEYQPSEKYLKKQRELIENFIWNKNNQNK
jgi:hypothetical protein